MQRLDSPVHHEFTEWRLKMKPTLTSPFFILVCLLGKAPMIPNWREHQSHLDSCQMRAGFRLPLDLPALVPTLKATSVHVLIV
jgi:hypothetical protein